MSPDPEDTDELPTGGRRARPAEHDDTAKLRIDLESGRTNDASKVGLHPYVEGIVRFYRARSVLIDAGSGPVARKDAERAWRYLARVGLRHLPHHMTSAHLELIYLVHTLHLDKADSDNHIDPEPFVRHVLDMARMIDDFVDRVFAPESQVK